jgi:hypothetical protein
MARLRNRTENSSRVRNRATDESRPEQRHGVAYPSSFAVAIVEVIIRSISSDPMSAFKNMQSCIVRKRRSSSTFARSSLSSATGFIFKVARPAHCGRRYVTVSSRPVKLVGWRTALLVKWWC